MIRFDYKQKLFLKVLFERMKDIGLEVKLDENPAARGSSIYLVDRRKVIPNDSFPPSLRTICLVDECGIELINEFQVRHYYEFNDATIDDIVEHAKEWL